MSLLHLHIQIFVLSSDSLNSVFKPLYLQARVTIVRKNILLLNFEGSGSLLSSPFLVNQLLILGLKKLVCVRGFAKFSVDKPVFSGESLDVFSELSDFLCLKLGQLCLLIDILSHILALTS